MKHFRSVLLLHPDRGIALLSISIQFTMERFYRGSLTSMDSAVVLQGVLKFFG